MYKKSFSTTNIIFTGKLTIMKSRGSPNFHDWCQFRERARLRAATCLEDGSFVNVSEVYSATMATKDKLKLNRYFSPVTL